MNAKQLRIVYMGTPQFAVLPLCRLLEEGYNVCAVVTVPDRPSGRGQRLSESPVKKFAAEAGIPLLQPEKLKDDGFLSRMRELDADLGIVIAFRMLPEAVWSMPRLGTFNLHGSLLPQYRGAAPINRAIMNGESLTGATTFFLNSQIDAGAIIDQCVVPIFPEDNAGTLHDKLMTTGAELVIRTIDKIAAGTAQTVAQPHINADLKQAPKIFNDDRKIDWSLTARAIHNQIRGLSPYPGAYTYLQHYAIADQPNPATTDCPDPAPDKIPVQLKVLESEYTCAVDAIAGEEPGTLIPNGKNSFAVRCADGYIIPKVLQPAGKRVMTAEEFLCGIKSIRDYRFLPYNHAQEK